MRHFYAVVVVGIIATGLAILPARVLAADNDPPQTQLTLSGTLGANGWYTSTVNATLRAQDLVSGPASTTYQLDTNTPITKTFSGVANTILNPSFEDGDFYDISNWDKGGSSGSLYQSSTPSKFGYGSAAVVASSSSYQYWTNVNYAVPVSAGQTYDASVWVKTVSLNNGPGAWMEAWASDSTHTQSEVQLAVSSKVVGDSDWSQLATDFTIPTGYDKVYLKLGAQSDGGMAFYDGVAMNAGTDGLTQFSIVENGSHTLSYSSKDNAGNTEATQTQSPIKIDTVAPQDWSSFGYSNTGNNHTFIMWANVRDVTSGINTATAQFQTYDSNGCDCWSPWMNVSSVKRVDNGSSASNGYTGYVTLTTPAYDYGNSGAGTMPEVQFRIDDMASSLGISPIYALFAPWIQLGGGGDIYSGGSISITGTPTGQINADGVIVTGGNSINGLFSLNQWYVKPYSIPDAPVNGIKTYIPTYDTLRAKAQSLPGGRLPSTTGVYLFSGKYTIDSNTLNAGFQSAVYNAIIIIDGDLAINQGYQLNAGSGVVFLVTGQIIYSTSVTQSAGILVSAKGISTGGSSSALTHNGSLIALGGFTLGRDLGRKGNPNNTTTPAETINFQPQYLANKGLAALLNGGTTSDFQWQESP